MARDRPCAVLGARRRTCHSNKPPRRINGRRVRLPSACGGSSRARTFPKWQSVLSLDQSCPTESSESRIDGTHPTHERGLPSTPKTVSEHERTFIRSRKSGWIWYVHPLSTTKPMCLPLVRRPRACRSLCLPARVAISTRGFEAIHRSTCWFVLRSSALIGADSLAVVAAGRVSGRLSTIDSS
eukprot:6179972-Pleurochrysis_carterae.AAC.2